MSTVAATNLKNASSSVNNAVTTSGGDLTNAAGVSFMGGSKNLLYNGAMQVAQRGTSTAGITVNGYYAADRWINSVSSLGTWTASVENDAPTGSGLSKSFKVLCTTAASSPSASGSAAFVQRLEGQDLQRIAKGTASAQQLSLSFWVKSNVTGTYIAYLYDNDNTRYVAASYTISASATWERKTITFPADTTGSFDNDNAWSLDVAFQLAVGSNFSSGTLQTTWATYAAANQAPGQVNLAAATNNYWQVTNVQLEVGPVATSFEFKSYGQELRECQRYYYLHASGANTGINTGFYQSATEINVCVSFPVTMRTAPTASVASGTNYYRIYRAAGVDTFNSLTGGIEMSAATGFLYNGSEVSGTAGNAGMVRCENASSSVAFSAEL